ncbi:MAG: hypothetical protein IBX55_02035 [Methyloprofundus sp.]|nr:hypothetical protein [Methyloprofundus sp.]
MIYENNALTAAINTWIDGALSESLPKRICCSCFATELSGYYSKDLLSRAYFVVVDELPLPTFLAHENPLFKGFLEMDMDAITYKNTYFIKARRANNMTLHFHELVHVIQWELLGAENFVERYLSELEAYGYDEAPLERMAYGLQGAYEKGQAFSVEYMIKSDL